MNVSLREIAAGIPGVTVRPEARVGDWAAWSLLFGDECIRVERPWQPTDVLREEWISLGPNADGVCISTVHEHVELDVDATVPAHQWLVNSGGAGSATFRSCDDIVEALCRLLRVLGLYKFECHFYRGGIMCGLFVSTADVVAAVSGRHADFGEALGKYSHIATSIDGENIQLVSRDPLVIAAMADHQFGYNPLHYLCCEHGWVEDECEECGG